MLKSIWRNLMSFKNIFKDDNDVNEKNVIGFMSFAVMVLFALADSFVIVTLGCFGIAGLEKFAKK